MSWSYHVHENKNTVVCSYSVCFFPYLQSLYLSDHWNADNSNRRMNQFSLSETLELTPICILTSNSKSGRSTNRWKCHLPLLLANHKLEVWKNRRTESENCQVTLSLKKMTYFQSVYSCLARLPRNLRSCMTQGRTNPD